MDEWEKQQQKEADMELVRREIQRKSLDIIRVYNPLDFTFKYTWDSRPFSVPSHKTADIERYLAKVYAEKIILYMIGQEMLKKGKELLELRQKQLGKTFIDKYEENKEVWDKTPRLNDERLITEYGKIVTIGLVREYGLEELEERPEPVEKKETAYDGVYNLMDRKIMEDDNEQS